MEENKNEEVVEETTQETTEQVDESKFESAGDDSIMKIDLSKPPKTKENQVKVLEILNPLATIQWEAVSI